MPVAVQVLPGHRRPLDILPPGARQGVPFPIRWQRRRADRRAICFPVPGTVISSQRVRPRRGAGSLSSAVSESPRCVRRGRGRAASDWRRAVAAVSERRVAEGRALYTERSPAELYREARSSERERYARQASRLGAQRPSTRLGRAGDHKVLDLLRSLGIHGERTSAATTLIAAPPTPVLVAKLHLHLLLLFLGHLRTSPCCCVPDSPSPARPPPAPEECYDGARR